MPGNGEMSNFCTLKIKRSADTIVTIERQKYFIKTDGYLYFYSSANQPKITTDTSCHHISNLPADSCSLKNEYFYNYFTDLYAEFIVRFDDGDIREYRKFSNWCPSYTQRDIMSSNRKRIMSYNCPTNDFIVFLIINQVEIFTKKPTVQKMALAVK
ncbi:MAG: hypothetical protein IPO24_09410 [Bacteroidetes bacterium]|nr:hypothetical protein [Bacteroidota bacterium]